MRGWQRIGMKFNQQLFQKKFNEKHKIYILLKIFSEIKMIIVMMIMKLKREVGVGDENQRHHQVEPLVSSNGVGAMKLLEIITHSLQQR